MGPYDAAEGADALLILTEWDRFRALDLDRIKALLKAPMVIDLRNIYGAEDMKRRGFHYASVGRPQSCRAAAPVSVYLKGGRSSAVDRGILM